MKKKAIIGIGLLVLAVVAVVVTASLRHRHAQQLAVASANATATAEVTRVLDQFGPYSPDPDPIDPDLVEQLKGVLQNSALSCSSLIDVGSNFHVKTRNDQATAVVFAAAIDRGHKVLTQGGQDEKQTRNLIIAMNRTRAVFWRMVHEKGHFEFLPAFNLLNCDLAQFISPDDKELAGDREKGMLFREECLVMLGKKEEALAECDSLSQMALSENGAATVAIDRGTILFQLGRLSESVPFFKTACTTGRHRELAAKMLLRVGNSLKDADSVEFANNILNKRSSSSVE